MRKLILIGLLILVLPVFGAYTKYQIFLDTAVAVNAGATADNGAEFTSKERPVPAAHGLLVVTFTRAAGSTATVDFYIQVSFDGGDTWSTPGDFGTFSVPTNTKAVSNVVRTAKLIYLYGVSHVRLWEIHNNDSENLTACNAGISY
jgi:hypothetical protein